jgi:hypothetical protein
MRFVLLFLVSMSALPSPARTQDAGQSWENLQTLGAGQRIQVVDQRLKSQDGTFLTVSDAAIAFRVGQSEVTIQRGDVLRVTSLERTRRGRNALVGLGIGALAGAAFLGIAAASDSFVREEAGLFAAGGAVLGGAVGAGVGAAFPGHPTIYRAERR